MEFRSCGVREFRIKDTPKSRRDTEWSRRDTPQSRRDALRSRRDTPKSRRDTLRSRRDTPQNRGDTQWSMRDTELGKLKPPLQPDVPINRDIYQLTIKGGQDARLFTE